MKKSYLCRLLSVSIVLLLITLLCTAGASAEISGPKRTLPPLPTLPGKESSAAPAASAEPTAAPAEAPAPTATAAPTEAPVKLDTLSKDRSGGSDINVLFIIGYILVFTVPLFVTVRNMSKLRKLDRLERRNKKAAKAEAEEKE